MSESRPHHQRRSRRNRRPNRRNQKTPPQPMIAPEAYWEFPIPDTRNGRGEYAGPPDFVPVPAGSEYDPDKPGLDVFGKVTVADLRFLCWFHQRQVDHFTPPPPAPPPSTTTSDKTRWVLNPEPNDKSLMTKPFAVHMKDKYYPLVVITCSGSVQSIFDLSRLKEAFDRVQSTHGTEPFDLVLDTRKVSYCATTALRSFYDKMVSRTEPGGRTFAALYFSRVCIVEEKKNTGLSDLLTTVSVSRVTIKDPQTKSIPFACVASNEEVEAFRSKTRPSREISMT